MHAPLKFPNSPEGKRLLRAREEYRRVTDQAKQSVKGPGVYLLYKNESFVNASNECESAERAYYMATKDESQLWFPPIPAEKWGAFQKSVEKHFGKIERDLNSKLVKILPWIYGFATAHAVVILEAVDLDRGIPITFFVTLRQRKPDEEIEFSNEVGYKGIGLGSSIELESIVRFQNPNGVKSRLNSNSEKISNEGLKNHAEKLLEYGKSFLTDPKADWAGVQKYLQQQREKLLAEKPWLKKYSGD